MDQKNTIVKCKAHPNCLFNHNGVCDNYVINIGEDGKCQCYIETELIESVVHTPEKIGVALKEVSKRMDIQRGQRAKGNFLEDAFDAEYEALFNAANNMLKPLEIRLKEDECTRCAFMDIQKWECKFPARPLRDPDGRCCRFTNKGVD